jgi:hypothetical protein
MMWPWWGSYMIGLAVLAGAAFLAGYVVPGAPTVPDLLVLAGPVALLAPVVCFVPVAAWHRQAPGAFDPHEADGSLADTGRRAFLAPMAFVPVVIVGCEVVAALALSWLMASASPVATGSGLVGINGPAAVVIASLVALPRSVLLAAARPVSYARLTARTGRHHGDQQNNVLPGLYLGFQCTVGFL